MSASDVRDQRQAHHARQGEARGRAPSAAAARWERPSFEVFCLACEISAYAPDEGEPLF
ncbi:MAG TPA: hypothetical protein VLC53_10670 [Myxococcota bacterium]|nr:hypothetical protein [Myxococcota bacterium]